MKETNPEWDAIQKRAYAIETLKEIESARVGQGGKVIYQISKPGEGLRDICITFIDNYPHCHWRETLANTIFRPALEKALEEYKAALTKIANGEDV